MSQTVKVKGYGRAVFPDHFTKEQMRTALRKKFNNAAESTTGALDAAATLGSAVVAEPVSGLAGIGSSIYNMDASKGADTVKAVQDAMTYQPRTAKGQEYLQNVSEFVEPVANLIGSASQNLGDKAYAATGSPTLAAAAYSVPTAIAEGIGLKGLNIARKPVSKADLYAVRMGGGGVAPITSVSDLFDLSPVDLANQLKKSDPTKVTHEGAWRVESNRFFTDYMPDGSMKMISKDGRVLKELSPSDSVRLFRERILEAEASKPEVQAEIQRRQDAIELESSKPEDYRMQHKAPTRSKGNPTADNLSDVFDSIYESNAVRLNSAGMPYDKKAIQIIQSLKGNPDKEVVIYRAVPKSVKEINAGDWVTTTKEYALDHMGDEKDWHIITKKVKAAEIASDGNSIHEFGFEPINRQ